MANNMRTKPTELQFDWREYLIDGYALAGCVVVLGYLAWRLFA